MDVGSDVVLFYEVFSVFMKINKWIDEMCGKCLEIVLQIMKIYQNLLLYTYKT